MRYYSQQTGTTYLDNIHKSMPDDAKPITEARYMEVIANPPLNKMRGHDSDGLPILIDPPAPDLAQQERQWRDGELASLIWLRDRHRDQQEIGAETTLSEGQFNDLLVYLQALRDWPQTQAFPDSTDRPAAPPWIAEQIQ